VPHSRRRCSHAAATARCESSATAALLQEEIARVSEKLRASSRLLHQVHVCIDHLHSSLCRSSDARLQALSAFIRTIGSGATFAPTGEVPASLAGDQTPPLLASDASPATSPWPLRPLPLSLQVHAPGLSDSSGHALVVQADPNSPALSTSGGVDDGSLAGLPVFHADILRKLAAIDDRMAELAVATKHAQGREVPMAVSGGGLLSVSVVLHPQPPLHHVSCVAVLCCTSVTLCLVAGCRTWRAHSR
jgi:hypothetical protein